MKLTNEIIRVGKLTWRKHREWGQERREDPRGARCYDKVSERTESSEAPDFSKLVITGGSKFS